MNMPLEDSVVDALEIQWEQKDEAFLRGTRITNCPEHDAQVRVLCDYFSRSRLDAEDLLTIAQCVLHRNRISYDESGFAFINEREYDEEEWVGVKVYDPIGEVYVSERAFDRLAARFLTAFVEGATRYNNPSIKRKDWPAFVAVAEQVRQRAYPALVPK